MFKPIGILIKTVPARSKIPEALWALQVRQVAQGSIVRVCADWPDEIIKRVKIATFGAGVLTIKAPGLVAAELQMRSEGLIREINQVFGRKVVHRIRFRVS